MPTPEIKRFIPATMALVLALSALLPMSVGAEVHRIEDAQTGWWWYYNQTAAEITDIINDNDARIVDIEVVSTDPLRFTAAFVHNTGVYESGWWWYYGVTVNEISTFLEQNTGRLIDIERYVDSSSGRELFACVMVPNTGDQAKNWWWYVGTFPWDVEAYIDTNNARLVDIESYDVSGVGRLYAVIMIENAGDDGTGWGWFYNTDLNTITAWMNENDMRMLEFEVCDPVEETFDAVLVSLDYHTPKTWWWWYGVTADQINGLWQQHAARITDIDTYTSGGTRYYNLVMLSNANDLTVEMGGILEWGSDGNTGAYLKEVDGGTLASLNPDFIFEPASTIKAVHHLHTMRDVMMGGADLSDPIQYSENYSGSCPIGGAPFTNTTLGEALRRMMVNSDNAATNGIAQLYGFGAINNTAQNIAGMTSTSINHTLGCGAAAIANPNRLTLRDLGGMYEQIQNLSLLDEPTRDTYYSLMQNQDTPSPWWFTTDLQQTIEDEAAALGTPWIADSFWANTLTAWKPGGYTLIFDGSNHEYISVGGIVSLPQCDGWPDIRYRHYAFGVFVDDGSNNSDTFQRVRDAARELLRDAVAAALQSCPTSVSDPLPLAADVMLEPNFPNPFNPATTLLYNLPHGGNVSLVIYDAAGRAVRELVAGSHEAGRHEVVWDGRDTSGRTVAAGIYLAKLVADGRTETRKLAMIK
jgi:hypothetical protein